jgi:hypothetical protein
MSEKSTATLEVPLGDGLVKILSIKLSRGKNGSINIEFPDDWHQAVKLKPNPFYGGELYFENCPERGCAKMVFPLDEMFLNFEDVKKRWRQELLAIKDHH